MCLQLHKNFPARKGLHWQFHKTRVMTRLWSRQLHNSFIVLTLVTYLRSLTGLITDIIDLLNIIIRSNRINYRWIGLDNWQVTPCYRETRFKLLIHIQNLTNSNEVFKSILNHITTMKYYSYRIIPYQVDLLGGGGGEDVVTMSINSFICYPLTTISNGEFNNLEHIVPTSNMLHAEKIVLLHAKK